MSASLLQSLRDPTPLIESALVPGGLAMVGFHRHVDVSPTSPGTLGWVALLIWIGALAVAASSRPASDRPRSL